MGSIFGRHARVAPRLSIHTDATARSLTLKFSPACANPPHPRRAHLRFATMAFSTTPVRPGCACAAARSSRPIAYIALGSNLGDRVAMIERACREMDSRGIRVKRTSSLWETEPMYVLDQNRFVNGACEVRCLYRACITKSYSTKVQPLIGGDGA